MADIPVAPPASSRVRAGFAAFSTDYEGEPHVENRASQASQALSGGAPRTALCSVGWLLLKSTSHRALCPLLRTIHV